MNVNSLPSNEKGKNVQSMVPNKAGWEKENVLVRCLCGLLNAPYFTVDTASLHPLFYSNFRSIINFAKYSTEFSNQLEIPKNIPVT